MDKNRAANCEIFGNLYVVPNFKFLSYCVVVIESYFRCESDDSSEEGGDLNPQIDFSISNDVHNTEIVDEDTVERTLVEDNMKSSSRGLNKNINATCTVGNNTICKVQIILILPVAVSKKVP